MKISRTFLTTFLCLMMISILNAQSLQTGSIRGTVTDPEGEPLPGVKITVTGPSLIGSESDTTSARGVFRIPTLPPGTYVIVAEIDGFQPIKREGVIVRVGMTVTISISMTPSELKEAVTVVAPSPTVDVQSSKLATTISTEVIERLPLNRSLSEIIATTPGTVGTAMHGGFENTNAYELDGLNVNDPAMHGRFVTVQYDAMEEVEIITGGLPAQVGISSGSFVNVVTKSGGNDFHGQVQAYYSNEDMTTILFPDYQLEAMGVGKPEAPIYSYDISAALGGPIIKDKLWFFADFNTDKSETHSPFIPTTIFGKSYEQYPLTDSNIGGFLKLTTQISENLRFFALGIFQRNDQPYSLWLRGPRNTGESLIARTPIKWTVTGNLSWLISANTFIDFRVGLVDLDMNQPYSEWDSTKDNPHYYDAYTGYNWGSPFRMGEYIWRNTKQASVRLTHFQDDFLGGDHELMGGVEYQSGVDYWGWWRPNPMHWRYYNGSPWYYRGVYGLDGPHPDFGDGFLWFAVCGPNEGETFVEGWYSRFSAYLQDSWTIKNRLTLNLGLRFDTYNSWIPAATKPAAAGIVEAIGATYLEPVYGFNPFGQLELPEWSDIMGWSPLSPRIGLTYDPFGDGKTAIKASYSQYAEAMPVMYFLTVHPFRPRELQFYWWDLNNNGIPDAPPTDSYESTGPSPIEMDESYFKKRLGENIKAPITDEFVFSINHELWRDVKVGVQYIWRKKENLVDTVMWDPGSDRYWYTHELAPDWWIPFTTRVPEYGPYPEQEVTLYMMSLDAPPWFTQFSNVPEARIDYQALEITFDKRMSNGWMLGGSVVFSKTEGDNTGRHGDVWGYSGAYDHANWWVNRYGRHYYDRPLIIKLYGSFDLPLGIMASFYYEHSSGTPFARTVEVFPPAGWAAAHNTNLWSWTVNVETPGDRRNPALDNVDFRIEKEFGLGKYGRIGFFLDVYNLLGNTYVSIAQNPAGRWFPVDANTNVGTYNPDPWYGNITGISASRTYKISVRYTF
jgi:hypothetical protein